MVTGLDRFDCIIILQFWNADSHSPCLAGQNNIDFDEKHLEIHKEKSIIKGSNFGQGVTLEFRLLHRHLNRREGLIPLHRVGLWNNFEAKLFTAVEHSTSGQFHVNRDMMRQN